MCIIWCTCRWSPTSQAVVSRAVRCSWLKVILTSAGTPLRGSVTSPSCGLLSLSMVQTAVSFPTLFVFATHSLTVSPSWYTQKASKDPTKCERSLFNCLRQNLYFAWGLRTVVFVLKSCRMSTSTDSCRASSIRIICLLGESVEENSSVVVKLLIRRPECFGPALRGEGGNGLLAAMKEAIKISETPALDLPGSVQGFSPDM